MVSNPPVPPRARRLRLRQFLAERPGLQFTLGGFLAIMVLFFLVSAVIFKVVGPGLGGRLKAYQELAARGVRHDHEGRHAEALADYHRALSLVEGTFDFRGEAATMKGRIRELRMRMAWIQEADAEWAAFRDRCRGPGPRDHGLFIDGVILYQRYGGSGLGWARDLEKWILSFGSREPESAPAPRAFWAFCLTPFLR